MKNKSQDIFDHDRMSESIRECCENVLFRSPRALEFLLNSAHKNAIPSGEEVKHLNELNDSRVLLNSFEELWFTLSGRPYYLPSFLERDEHALSKLRSMARPIFIEYAQKLLLSQECIAPNNSSNHQATPNSDENSDLDNNLSNP